MFPRVYYFLSVCETCKLAVLEVEQNMFKQKLSVHPGHYKSNESVVINEENDLYNSAAMSVIKKQMQNDVKWC